MALCQLEHCIADISCWMSQNGLKLNHEKTEWIIFNGNTNLIKDVELHIIGTQTIQQSKVIKNLGVKLDSELTLQSQISDVCRISYYHPWAPAGIFPGGGGQKSVKGGPHIFLDKL